MKCVDYCHQGRISCPTPHACGLPTRKLHTGNSDGSATDWHGTCSASAPMPLQFVGDEPADDPSPYESFGLWFFGVLAAGALIITLAFFAGMASARLGWF